MLLIKVSQVYSVMNDMDELYARLHQVTRFCIPHVRQQSTYKQTQTCDGWCGWCQDLVACFIFPPVNNSKPTYKVVKYGLNQKEKNLRILCQAIPKSCLCNELCPTLCHISAGTINGAHIIATIIDMEQHVVSKSLIDISKFQLLWLPYSSKNKIAHLQMRKVI